MDKAKKKRIILAAVAVLVVAAVAVTSILIVQKKKRDEMYDPMVSGDVTENFDENYIDPDTAKNIFELDYAEPDPVEHSAKLDVAVKADTSAFIDELGKKEVGFEYADFYQTAKHIKEQRPLDKVEKHKYDVTNGNGVVEADALYETVLKNNKDYFAKQSKDDVPLYEESQKKYIKQACQYIAEYVNKAKESGEWTEIDFNRVYCNLATLKILHRTTGDFSLAFVDENNILSINPETIDNSKTMAVPQDKEMSDKEMAQFVWDTTLVHEIMHLLQDSCPCIEKDDEFLLGNMRMSDADEDKAHPLCNLWFAEASAELGMSKMLNVEPVTYENFINYYYTVLLSFCLDPQLSPEKIMHITYDADCYPFYKAFGSLDEKQTEEIVNMFYNVELMMNDSQSFTDWYNEKHGVNLDEREDEKELVRQKLRVELLKCATKYFYVNLAKQAQSGKMSYNDMFYLIRLFERALYAHQLYEQEDRAMTSNMFFDDYLSVQDAFFEAVASGEVTKDELVKDFESYTKTCKKDGKTADNFSLAWLNEEQQYAVEKANGNYYFINLPTVRGAKALYTEKGYDKSLKY